MNYNYKFYNYYDKIYRVTCTTIDSVTIYAPIDLWDKDNKTFISNMKNDMTYGVDFKTLKKYGKSISKTKALMEMI